MALLDSKQLNPKLTGSFILSGSTQTFIGRSDFQGSITASGDISASGTVFADTFQSTGGDVNGISFTDDLNLSGNLTASGDISSSANIFGTGNLDIDGTSNLQGDVTLQSDLSVVDINASGNITGSEISASGDLSATGNLDIDGSSNLQGNVTLQNNLTVNNNVTASGNISGSATSTGSFGQLVISNDGDIALIEDQRIHFEADKRTYIESHASDTFRVVVNNRQMFLLDEDTGNRAIFGNGTKVFIGSNNNRIPTASLHIGGDIFLSGSNGNVTASGNISSSGNLSATGNLDIDGTSNLAGDVTFQSDLSVVDINASGNITGSEISASGDLSATGNLDIDGTSNFAGNVTMQNDLTVTGRIDAEEIHTTFISSSIAQATGSNIFGDSTTDSHQFTGSVDISGSLRVSDGDVTISDTLTATNIGAFNLTGKLTAGGTEIEGSAFDIDGGTVDNITSLTAANNLDIGAHDLRAETLTADGLTATRVVFAGTNGVLSDDSDLTFSGNTLSATQVTATNITASADISASGDLSATGNLDIDGSSNLQGNVTLQGDIDVDGTTNLDNTDIDGTFTVDGTNTTITSTVVSLVGAVTASSNISASGVVTAEGLIISDDANITDDLTVGGNLDISDTIFHTGDSNTKIRFPEVDTISFHTSGQERLRISSGGHITGSGNVSSSFTSTGSFGRVVGTTFSGDGSELTGLVDAASISGSVAEPSGNISGSSTSTGSFGHVSVGEMSINSISALSSSIATELNTISADIIALSIALG